MIRIQGVRKIGLFENESNTKITLSGDISHRGCPATFVSSDRFVASRKCGLISVKATLQPYP